MSDETRRDFPDQQDAPAKKRRATEAQRLAGINNLKAFNASRNNKPAFKHGVKSFINTGAAPDNIERQLDQLEEGLVKDLGGAPSTSQLCLIQSIRTCLGVCLLVEAYIRQGGLRDFRKNRWLLGVSAAHHNTLRLNLKELTGEDWRGKQAADLVAELDQKRTKNSLQAVIAATEEAAVALPTWAKEYYARPSTGSDSLIDGLPEQPADASVSKDVST